MSQQHDLGRKARRVARFGRRNYLRLIGLLVLGLILLKIDLKSLSGIFSQAKFLYLAIAVCLTIPVISAKTWRWKYLLGMQQIDYSFKRSFATYLCGIYLGVVTPGRVGDFIKVAYLKRDTGVSFGRAFSSVLVDRLLDLTFLVIVVSLGLFVFSFPNRIAIIPFLSLFLLLMLLLFSSKGLGERGLRWFYAVLISQKLGGKLQPSFESFCEGMEELKSIKLVTPVLITFVSYLVFFAQCYFAALSLNILIPFLYLAFCVSITSIASLLPISIFGVGTRDLLLIALFSPLGLGAEAAIGFSVMVLFIVFITAGVMGGFAWFRNPIDVAYILPEKNREP